MENKTLIMKVDINDVDFERLREELHKWFYNNECGMGSFRTELKNIE